MKKTGLYILLTLSVLLAVLLTACSSSDEKKKGDGNTTEEAGTSEVTTLETTTHYGPLPDVLEGEHFEGVDLSEYVKIAPYDGHVFSVADYNELFDYYYGIYMSNFGIYDDVPADTPLKLYDKTVFSFEGKPEDPAVTLSEQTLAGMKSEEYEIILGSDSFIGAYEKADDPTGNTKGFEEQMVGMKIGETKELLVTFPDGYSEELGGLRVIFTVTIKSAKTPGKITDEQAVENGFESAQMFLDVLENAIKSETLFNFIMDESEVTGYPEKDLADMIDEYLDSFIEYMQQYSETELSEEDIASLREENTKDATEWAESFAKETMIVMYLGKLENQSVTKDEYLKWIADQYGEETPYTDVENYYGRDVIYCQILLNESIESALKKVTFEK